MGTALPSDSTGVELDIQLICTVGGANLSPIATGSVPTSFRAGLCCWPGSGSILSLFSLPELESSAVVPGTKGGALAFRRDCKGFGLTPRDVNSDTGVVGGFRGIFGEMLPPWL